MKEVVFMPLLHYNYEIDPIESKMSGFGGMMPYFDLIDLLNIPQAVDRFMGTGGSQGWMDRQHVLTGIILNLAGGDCVDDILKLENDKGLCEIMKVLECTGMSRLEKKLFAKRFRKGRTHTFPSFTAVRNWLSEFHNAEEEGNRKEKTSFIPAPNEKLKGLIETNNQLIQNAVNLCKSTKLPPLTCATIDLDATFTETQKRNALYCYKGFKAYQGLTAFWSETGLALFSDFRDGNVTPSFNNYEAVRQVYDMLTSMGIYDLWFRSDSAAYQHEILHMLDSGDNNRWPRVKFSVPCKIVKEFREAVSLVEESDWEEVRNKKGELMYEWANVAYAPYGLALSKSSYRYIAIRTPKEQGILPGTDENNGREDLDSRDVIINNRAYRLSGLTTNIEKTDGKSDAEIIEWNYQRCGKGEEVHAIMKNDLAGGQLPSELFGANAAWWGIMLLAFNVHAVMRMLVLPGPLKPKRFKALRFMLLQTPARVVEHGRQLYIRLARDNPIFDILKTMRKVIASLSYA